MNLGVVALQPVNLLPPQSLPDLSDLKPHSGRMALKRVLQAAGPRDQKAHSLQLNAVRLADLALSEYTAGRNVIYQYHNERHGSGIAFIFRASGHFEGSMFALERFLKHVQKLRGAEFAPSDLKLLMPRNLRILQSSAEHQIVEMRHIVAHLESRVLEGEPESTPPMLLPLDVGLCVGSCLITWDDVETWLREIHQCASALADYTQT